MKKGVLILLVVLGLVSCQSGLKKEGQLYYYTTSSKDGTGSNKEVKFTISDVLVDSLKLEEEVIIKMCKQSVLYADWSAKYKPTYRLPSTAQLYFVKSNDEIICSIGGTCQNAFGVADNITTFITLDKKGNIIYDGSGLPKITSF